MKLTAAVLALATGAMATAANNGTVVSYTTEVVTAVTTYCPGPTEIAYGTHTYTISEVCFARDVAAGTGSGRKKMALP